MFLTEKQSLKEEGNTKEEIPYDSQTSTIEYEQEYEYQQEYDDNSTVEKLMVSTDPHYNENEPPASQTPPPISGRGNENTVPLNQETTAPPIPPRLYNISSDPQYTNFKPELPPRTRGNELEMQDIYEEEQDISWPSFDEIQLSENESGSYKQEDYTYADTFYEDRNPYECLERFHLHFEVSGGTVLRDGNILLTSYHAGEILVFKGDGEIVKRVKAKHVWDAAAGVDTSEYEQVVYVTFVKQSARKKARVDFFSVECESFSLFTKDVAHPLGVACSSTEVFVSDKRKIKVFFVSDGCIKYTIKNNLFKNPWFIALKREKHLLVSDFDAHCVFLIDLRNPRVVNKTYQMTTDSYSSEFLPGKCVFRRGICFLSDQKGGKVGIITDSGRMKTFIENIYPGTRFVPFLLLMNSRDDLVIMSKSGRVAIMRLDYETLEDYTKVDIAGTRRT